MQEAAEKKGKADEETQEKVKKVKAAEHEKRAKSDANLAARKALGGDKAKWASWSKSGAAPSKPGPPQPLQIPPPPRFGPKPAPYLLSSSHIRASRLTPRMEVWQKTAFLFPCLKPHSK